MSPIPLLCNGQEIISDTIYDVLSPGTSPKTLYQVSALANKVDIESICTCAQEGFQQWSRVKYSEKVKILKNCFEVLKGKRSEFIQCFRQEGLPEWFVEFNAEQLLQQFEEYINQITNSDGEVIKSELCDLAITVRDPIGPVLSISPWNAPGILIGRSISAPLAAGCSVIVKSSELSPKAAYLLVKCLHEGGVPHKAVQLVNIEQANNVEFVKAFIENSNIKKIAFTGSSTTGGAIAQVAAANFKPCLLELGGKNCCIIESDADLNTAIPANLWGSWGHRGQICMSTEKIYIHESRYDEFKQLLDPIITEVLKDSDYFLPQRTGYFTGLIASIVNDALKKGANVVWGQIPDCDNPQQTLGPLILDNISSDMTIAHKEIFGPVVCLYKYNDSDELINLLNKEPYGLKTSIWTKNIIKAHKMARFIESGGVHINSPTIYDEPTAPHGGVKTSGYGRFNSKWGLEEFSYVKVITMCE